MDILHMIDQFAWIGWIVLIAVFLVIEMTTLDFIFLMFGIGSVAGLLADVVGAPVWLQVIVFALVSVALLLVLRPPLLRRLHRGEDTTPSNIAALLGLPGYVLSTVSGASGQVKLSNGDIWTARTESGELAPGTPVLVDRIDGATAHVRPSQNGEVQ